MRPHITFLLFILCILLLSYVHSEHILGVNPAELSKYTENGDYFRCLDGTKVIPMSSVNDDYCDCKDGSDEPGTAACSHIPTAKFYCQNKGFIPKIIHTSKVNDGICDCCDGSDEYDGTTHCKNTCAQEGAEIRQSITQQLEATKKGLEIKKQNIEESTKVINEKKEELAKLEAELQTLEKELETLQAEKEKAEKLEEIERNLLREKKKQEREAQQKQEVQPTETTPTETQSTETQPTEGEQKEESKDSADQEKKEGENAVPSEPKKEEDEEVKNYKSQGFFDKIVSSFKNAAQMVTHAYYYTLSKYYGTYNATAAEEARSKHNEKKTAVDSLKSRIDELKKITSIDFGKENEFYPLKGKCFEIAVKEYTYELCPFDKANQKDRFRSSISLGTWGKWEDGYSKMKFENGMACWNGPQRTALVTLHCGETDKILAVDEPSRCVYTMDFQTPAACTEERVTQLENDLKQLTVE